MRTLLFQVSALDPYVLTLAAVSIFLLALAASISSSAPCRIHRTHAGS
jgi:hypothetical protein